MRRVLITLAAALGLLVPAAVPALAADATTQAPVRPLAGPECAPNVVGAVLASLQRNGINLPPGTKVQYLQVRYDPALQRNVIEPCVVTVPAQ